MHGKVIFFSDRKGWGFIRGNDGLTYFAHVSCIKDEAPTLTKGEAVEFDEKVVEGKSPKAVEIQRVGK